MNYRIIKFIKTVGLKQCYKLHFEKLKNQLTIFNQPLSQISFNSLLHLINITKMEYRVLHTKKTWNPTFSIVKSNQNTSDQIQGRIASDHLVFSWHGTSYSVPNIRCTVSFDFKMDARNRPLIKSNQLHFFLVLLPDFRNYAFSISLSWTLIVSPNSTTKML